MVTEVSLCLLYCMRILGYDPMGILGYYPLEDLQAQSGQALPRHLCGEAAEPISSAECVYTPTLSHTHTHMRRVACWLLSAGDGSRGDTALPRPQPVDEPRPALPALRGPLPSKPHSQPGQPSKSPWQQLPEFFWSLRHPSLLEWKPSVTVC